MSLQAYKNIKQTTDNSCGAFALAAALSHMGRAQIIGQLNTERISDGFNTPAPAAFAQRIYQITGCIVLGMTEATYKYTAPVSNRNAPSAMAYMASQLGMQTNQIRVIYNNDAGRIFGSMKVNNPHAKASLLETETALIAPYGSIAGPTIYQHTPQGNEVDILLVNDCTHWVVITRDEIYDSGTGFVGKYTPSEMPLTFLTYTDDEKTHKLTFSGLWIELV